MDRGGAMDRVTEFLYGLRAHGIRPGLGPTRAVLNALGAPDRAFSVIQVAGSVGKGSTVAVSAAMLQAAGLRVGAFTSPHLVRFAERFVVDGVPVAEADIAEALSHIRRNVPWAAGEGTRPPAPNLRPLTFFEWCTVLACVLFRKAAVDVAVLETGLGGRWDATTACHADVTAITRIDLEHTEILGTTLAAIAGEKAGVLRAGTPAVTVLQTAEALDVITAQAAAVNAPLTVVGRDVRITAHDDGSFDYRSAALDDDGGVDDPRAALDDDGGVDDPRAALDDDGGFDCRSGGLDVPRCVPGLAGRHQIENAALAIAAVEALTAGRPDWPRHGQTLEHVVRAGVNAASLAGRFEAFAPGLWLDGAHTPASMSALAATVTERLPGGRAHVVFAALREKPVETLLAAIRPVAASVTLTCAGGDRAVDPAEYADAVQGWGVPVQIVKAPMEAVACARRLAQSDPVLVCGSLYLVGAIRARASASSVEPGDPGVVLGEQPRQAPPGGAP